MVGRKLSGIWNFALFKVIESSQQYYKISNLILLPEEETEACRRMGNFPKLKTL